MSAALDGDALGPALLDRLPRRCGGPATTARALGIGMAHLGVGAFHRCHQAEFTDDTLEAALRPLGRRRHQHPPAAARRHARPAGRPLYPPAPRRRRRRRARRSAASAAVVDSQDDATPALAVLPSPGDRRRHDDGHREGLLPPARHRRARRGASRHRPRPCPSRAAAERAGAGRARRSSAACVARPAGHLRLLRQHPGQRRHPRAVVVRRWPSGAAPDSCAGSTANAAFPSTMVDRIVPATTPEDIDVVERASAIATSAVVVGEPFRQWVIEDRFAGRTPPWDLAGATFVDDVTPYELLKMRVLNAAQTDVRLSRRARRARAHLRRRGGPGAGRLRAPHAGRREPADAAAGARHRRRSPMSTRASAGCSNTAIRHRNHQIATDGSQKIVQRLLNPIRERLGARRASSG